MFLSYSQILAVAASQVRYSYLQLPGRQLFRVFSNPLQLFTPLLQLTKLLLQLTTNSCQLFLLRLQLVT